MKCTQCKTLDLEPRELEPGLVAAVCQVCNGALVSLMNYRFWADQLDCTELDVDDAINRAVSEAPAEQESVNQCPKCSRLMLKYQIDPHTHRHLDLCAACDEAWLEKGEWQLLKKLDLQDKLPKIFTDAWQRNIRKQRQETALLDRYLKVLGAGDLAKATEFKLWLQNHPQKNAIKQFLIIE